MNGALRAWTAWPADWWAKRLFAGPDPVPEPVGRRFWLGMLVVAGVAALLLFPRLSYPLVEPDEGRYAEIGREMLRSGDWIVPRLNQVPYYDKPPLLYWLVAMSVEAFGATPQAARLVPAISAFLTILATFWFAARLFGTRTGVLAGLCLSMMTGFAQSGRFVIIDGVLTLTEAGALMAAYEAVRGGRFRQGWWLTSAVCCALGVLAKGPISMVLVVIPVALFVWLHRRGPRVGLRQWLAYGAVAVLLSAPWFVAMSVREPAFAWDFVVVHHLLRFLGPEMHAEPFWYYLPVALVACFPWSFLFYPLGRFLCSRTPALAALRPQALGFCALWLGWCVLFFSLSRGKLPTYILPGAPALAVMLGWFVEVALFRAEAEPICRSTRRWMPAMVFIGVGLVWIGVGILGARMGFVPAGRQLWLAVPGALATGLGLLAATGWRRMPVGVAWSASAVVVVAFLHQVMHQAVPSWAAQRSPLAAVAGAVRDPGTVVACDSGEEWGCVPYAMDRDRAFMHVKGHTEEEIRALLSGHRRGLVFISPDECHSDTHPALVPPGERLFQVIRSGKASVLDIRPVSADRSDDQATR